MRDRLRYKILISSSRHDTSLCSLSITKVEKSSKVYSLISFYWCLCCGNGINCLRLFTAGRSLVVLLVLRSAGTKTWRYKSNKFAKHLMTDRKCCKNWQPTGDTWLQWCLNLFLWYPYSRSLIPAPAAPPRGRIMNSAVRCLIERSCKMSLLPCRSYIVT